MFFTFLLIAWHSANAQETNTNYITLKSLLKQWNDSIGLQYSGKEELLNSCSVSGFEQPYRQEYLDRLIAPCNLSTKMVNDVIIIQKHTKLNLFDGFIRDSLTKEPIPNAALVFGRQGTTTDEEGYFIITSDKLRLDVSVSHVGYGTKRIQLNPATEANILLTIQFFELNEVSVHSENREQGNSLAEEEGLLRKERIIDAGFYRNLQDLITDSAFKAVRVQIRPVNRNHGVIYHRLRLSKQSLKEVGNIFGFSDGRFVYINPKTPKPRRLADFYRIEHLGPYIYFKEEARINPNNQIITWLAERLVDKKTGETFTLTRNRLREIITDDVELLELFNAEKGKSGKLKLYLIEYLRRKDQENSEMK